MSAHHEPEVILLRHSLRKDERPAAAAMAGQLDNGLELNDGQPILFCGAQLVTAIGRLLDLLSRPETALLFILDGEEHLTAKQIGALRRRASDPRQQPRCLHGSLPSRTPEPRWAPDGTPLPLVSGAATRFRISTILDYLTDLREFKSKVRRKPILESFTLPPSELSEAMALAEALLTRRSANPADRHPNKLPQSILFALIDLVTVLIRGTPAFMLVLDHHHLADATQPGALARYSCPALSLAEPSSKALPPPPPRKKNQSRRNRLTDLVQERAGLSTSQVAGGVSKGTGRGK